MAPKEMMFVSTALLVFSVTFVKCRLNFKLDSPLDIDLSDYQQCLDIFYRSQPVWSWIVLHEQDQIQPFDRLLRVIYSIGVPIYNYDESRSGNSGVKWFSANVNISGMSLESKIFILSRNKFHVNLMMDGSESFRRGDKILFTNYDMKKRVDFNMVMNFFGMKTSVQGLTRYNLLPIVSFLYVSSSGKADPVTYLPTHRSHIHQVERTHLTCDKLYSNSLDKLIFQSEQFTIAVFESVHAIKGGRQYFGRDAIVAKILIGCTRFPYVYISPTDGQTHGDERNNSGVYGQVVKGQAQMALNSRLFLTKILTDNLVEYTYPYNRDDIVILVPIEVSTSRLFYFTYYSYGISLGAILVLFAYFRVSKQAKPLVEVLMIFVQICSGKPLTETEQKAKYFGIVYMSMMVLAFYGYTLFNIQILSALALKPAELSIKSVEDFSVTDYKIMAAQRIKAVLTESFGQDPMGQKILSRVQIFNESDLQAEEALITNRTEYAIICPKSTALYYMSRHDVKNNPFYYKMVPEAILPSLVTYILGYRSPFQDKFDELLSRIIENGLVGNYTENPLRKRVAISESVQPFGMGKPSEKLAWIVYGIGILIGFLIFLIEVAVCPYWLS